MKIILLKTSNSKKVKEFNTYFSHYGIKIEQTTDEFPETIGDYFCFMKEETLLLDDSLNKVEEFKDLLKVGTYSKLSFSFDGKNFSLYTSSTVNGYLDLSKRLDSEDVFGWDDIFVSFSTGISLHELSQINSKVIGRRENLARFAKEHLYYKDRLDLNFNQFNKDETIFLDDSVHKFIHSNKYLNSPTVKASGFHNLLNQSMHMGAFFRSAKNRREKNYWLPGLNAGIPLVAKDDPIHEITFAVHDFMHFIIPDLVFSGNDSEVAKHTYVLSRMMSEALTLVLADGWFISNLSKDFDYDWNKRKIYPLFRHLDLNNRNTLSVVLYNMCQYVLKGDDKYLETITFDDEAIKEFKYKYDSFFVEDYKWTIKNWENMVSQKEFFEKWSSDVDSVLPFDLIHVDDMLNSIEEEKGSLNKDVILEYLVNFYINFIMKILDEKQEFNSEEALVNSFKHYMTGQLFIFSKYNFLSISKVYRDKIVSRLETIRSVDEFKEIRDFFNSYIDELSKLNLIDKDDEEVYKEIYPLFSPYFAFYDKEKSYYNSIESYYEAL